MQTTKLNNTTQKARKWVNDYKNSFCNSVNNFYNNCSSAKVQAEIACKNRMLENNCHDYKVLNGNCSHFTCGYISHNNKTLYIETASNIFEIEL